MATGVLTGSQVTVQSLTVCEDVQVKLVEVFPVQRELEAISVEKRTGASVMVELTASDVDEKPLDTLEGGIVVGELTEVVLAVGILEDSNTRGAGGGGGNGEPHEPKLHGNYQPRPFADGYKTSPTVVPSEFVAYVSSSEVKIARFETIVGVYEPVEPELIMTDTNVSPEEGGRTGAGGNGRLQDPRVHEKLQPSPEAEGKMMIPVVDADASVVEVIKVVVIDANDGICVAVYTAVDPDIVTILITCVEYVPITLREDGKLEIDDQEFDGSVDGVALKRTLDELEMSDVDVSCEEPEGRSDVGGRALDRVDTSVCAEKVWPSLDAVEVVKVLEVNEEMPIRFPKLDIEIVGESDDELVVSVTVAVMEVLVDVDVSSIAIADKEVEEIEELEGLDEREASEVDVSVHRTG
ncbi:uncharacterized protein PAC_17655 [Phialocephala subalpina]|uniref:Uncharacterized protein n=1 Tax=Phialocephala subalpina TaxID=576137 RepID=A0A1L7XRS1_9HELO|nr:uncharacterized protein PAC_17655 [Phialocephala subalpina]